MENYRLTYTPRRVNWLCFFIGMLTVGFATDWGWIPLIGAWVASLHFTINCDRFGQFK